MGSNIGYHVYVHFDVTKYYATNLNGCIRT